MTTTADILSQVLGADTANPDSVDTWESRARIARAFNVELIRHMGKRTLFTVRFPGLPFIRKRIPWSWLLKPLMWVFDKAVEEAQPTDEAEVAAAP